MANQTNVAIQQNNNTEINQSINQTKISKNTTNNTSNVTKNTANIDLSKTINEYKNDMSNNVNNVMNNVQNITYNGMSAITDGIEQAKKSSASAILDLTSSLIQGFGGIAVSGLQCNETFMSSMGALQESANSLLGDVMGPIAEGITANLLPVAMDAMNQLSEGFATGGLEGLMEAGSSIMVNLASGMSENMPVFTEQIVGLINTFLPVIQENLPIIIASGMQILTTLLEGIVTMLPSLIETAVTIITSLVSGLSQQLPMLIPVAITAILTLFNALIENLPTLIDAGVQLIMALIDGLLNALPQLVDQIPQLILKLFNTLVENLPKILEAGRKIIEKLVAGVVEYGPKLWENMKEIAEKMMKKVSEIDWMELGKNILRGIINGLGSLGDWAVQKIGEACSTIFQGIKDFFGIESPSKLMRDEIGKFIPMGIEVGFTARMPDSISIMKKKLDVGIASLRDHTLSMSSQIAFHPYASWESGQNSSKAITYHVNQTINSAKQLRPSEISLETENMLHRLEWKI